MDIHPLHIDRRQAEEDTQHGNDRREREEREHRREQVEQDVQCHLPLVGRNETAKDMCDIRTGLCHKLFAFVLTHVGEDLAVKGFIVRAETYLYRQRDEAFALLAKAVH